MRIVWNYGGLETIVNRLSKHAKRTRRFVVAIRHAEYVERFVEELLIPGTDRNGGGPVALSAALAIMRRGDM